MCLPPATGSQGFPAPLESAPVPQRANSWLPRGPPLPPKPESCDSSSRIFPPLTLLPRKHLSKRFASNMLHTNMQVWAPNLGFGPALRKFNRCALWQQLVIACLGLSFANRGFKMKAILSLVVLAAL